MEASYSIRQAYLDADVWRKRNMVYEIIWYLYVFILSFVWGVELEKVYGGPFFYNMFIC